MRAAVDIEAAKPTGLISEKELIMSQQTKTISTFVLGAFFIVLTITSAANAQQGSFEGQYSGVGEAAGAGLTLAQSGAQVVGLLQVGGEMYNIQARVSGAQGSGVVADPTSGATLPLRLSLNGGELLVVIPQTASASAQVHRFQRGSVAAASADRRARRRERVKRVFAGAAIVAIAAAASNNTSSGSSDCCDDYRFMEDKMACRAGLLDCS